MTPVGNARGCQSIYCYFSTILIKSNGQGSFVRALPARKLYHSMISMLNFQALAGNTVSQRRKELSGLEPSAGALGKWRLSKKPCG